MSKIKEIFVITVFEKFEKKAVYSEAPKNKGQYLFDTLDLGDKRTWGWYSNYNDALTALKENHTDMWETIYNYACIEGVDEGVIAHCTKFELFKFDKDTNGYVPFTAPEDLNDFIDNFNTFGMIFG